MGDSVKGEVGMIVSERKSIEDASRMFDKRGSRREKVSAEEREYCGIVARLFTNGEVICVAALAKMPIWCIELK